MKNLAIIPARGGSKRIPKKNIKDFLSKPIIAYSIETALKCDFFDTVMVSTDDREIADIAKQFGASIPFWRSKENASDYATTVDVLLEVIKMYEQEATFFDNVCCIYPTAPFITIQDLKQGLKFLNSVSSCLPVVEFEFPIFRALKNDKNQTIRFAWPEHEKTRSQDLETFYHDAGQWYWIQTRALLQQKTLITASSKSIRKSRMVAQDIDTEDDWKLAELKYSLMNE